MKLTHLILFYLMLCASCHTNQSGAKEELNQRSPGNVVTDTVIKGGVIDLPFATVTAHTKGDEELAGPDKTMLFRTSFALTYDSSHVSGYLQATIAEPKGDLTTFVIEHVYPIFTASNGFKIIGVSIPGNKKLQINFDDWQRGFGGQEKTIGEGPLKKIFWIGDTGSDQDQINGCRIKPFLNDIKITLSKIN